MPEIRGPAGSGSNAYRPRVAEYGILRSISTGAARRMPVPVLSAEDMKENIPIKGCPKVPAKRSPLPSWYPRRHLNDITAIIKEIERRRAELQATRHQINNRVPNSPEGGSSPVSVLEQQEPSAPESPSSSSRQSAGSITTTTLSASKSPPSVISTYESTNDAVVGPADLSNKEEVEEPPAPPVEAASELKDSKKKKLEELKFAVEEEHMKKSMPKVTVQQPAKRSTLLSLR